MKVLVTGGAGYIGSVLVPKLEEAGWEVVVLDKRRHAGIRGDIRGPVDVAKSLIGCHAVIHLAAVVGEDAYNKNHSKGRMINIHGTQIVVSEAREKGIKRLVFASTGNIYGRTDSPARESAVPKPLCQYGYSKLIGEEIVKEAGYVCVRFGTACGASPQMRWDLLPNAVAKAARENKQLDIYSPEAWRPFTHIQDATDALVELVERDTNNALKGKVFNIVSENVQKGHLVSIARDEFGWDKVRLLGMPDKRDYQMSGELIEKTIGWVPRHTVREAMIDAFTAC